MGVAHGQFAAFQRQLALLRPSVGGGADIPALIEERIRSEKAAGSRDRRLYRELHYTWLRFRPWLEGLEGDALASALALLCSDIPACAVFRRTFAGEDTFSSQDPVSLLPPWFPEECPMATGPALARSLATRAPLWLRLQGDSPDEALLEMRDLGWTVETSSAVPGACRVGGDRDVTKLHCYETGAVEVQDIGSQSLLQSLPLVPGERWLDACAGAGGKTLQLAWLLGPAGSVEACDPRASALDELLRRASRARIRSSNGHREAPLRGAAPLRLSVDAAAIATCKQAAGPYDGVLVDAPCSGSGTWRRSPHLKWATTRESLMAKARLQLSILSRASSQVRSGGLLVYATCSLCRTENEAVVEAFLSGAPGWRPLTLALPSLSAASLGSYVLPQTLDSDGFYVCALRRD